MDQRRDQEQMQKQLRRSWIAASVGFFSVLLALFLGVIGFGYPLVTTAIVAAGCVSFLYLAIGG